MAIIALVLGVFTVSFIIGILLIGKVPSLLHTPLMSMTNAISAVTILGCLVLFSVESGLFELLVGGAALMMAAFNLFGGFAVTARMLKMFKTRDAREADH
jgi:NAD(P) transhydrogenase subunit alpha